MPAWPKPSTTPAQTFVHVATLLSLIYGVAFLTTGFLLATSSRVSLLQVAIFLVGGATLTIAALFNLFYMFRKLHG
jgi:hypothetical protein